MPPARVSNHIAILKGLDWETRHDCFARIFRRSQILAFHIADNMPPDLLMCGCKTGRMVELDTVIPLPDKLQRQTVIEDYFVRSVRRRT